MRNEKPAFPWPFSKRSRESINYQRTVLTTNIPNLSPAILEYTQQKYQEWSQLSQTSCHKKVLNHTVLLYVINNCKHAAVSHDNTNYHSGINSWREWIMLWYVHEDTQAEVLVTDHRLLPMIVAAISLFSNKQTALKTKATNMGMFHTNVPSNSLQLAAVSENVIWKGTGLSGRSRECGLWDNTVVHCIKLSACIKTIWKHLQGFRYRYCCLTECHFFLPLWIADYQEFTM